MKKLYASLLMLAAIGTANAQYSITATNIPAPGETYNYYMVTVDAVSTDTNGYGTGKTYNYSNITVVPPMGAKSYMAPSSTPYGSSFTSSTIAENDTALSTYTFFSGTTNYQINGMVIADPQLTATVTLSDPGVIFSSFPVNYNYYNFDALSGTVNTQSFGSGTVTGDVTTRMDGNGTLNLPGMVFNNVSRVKSETNLNVVLGGGLITVTQMQTRYQFYNAQQKFPLYEISIVDFNGQIQTTAMIHASAFVGMNELANSEFSIYPNPAKNVLHISAGADLKNGAAAEVINQLGQTVREFKVTDGVGKNISLDLNGIASGVYFVKLKNEGHSSVKKFIVE